MFFTWNKCVHGYFAYTSKSKWEEKKVKCVCFIWNNSFIKLIEEHCWTVLHLHWSLLLMGKGDTFQGFLLILHWFRWIGNNCLVWKNDHIYKTQHPFIPYLQKYTFFYCLLQSDLQNMIFKLCYKLQIQIQMYHRYAN